MTGVKTNIVTAVEIAGRDAHDSPMFKPLFKETVRNGFRRPPGRMRERAGVVLLGFEDD
jgi:hypothetical protein